MLLQLAGLLGLNLLGRWIAQSLHLPLPGSVIGMLLLFCLLMTRVIRLEWVEPTAALFNRHLAFFFVPIAVGLLAYGSVIRSDGALMLLAGVLSVTAGIAVTGAVVTWLQRAQPEER